MSEYAYEHCPRVVAIAKLFAGFTVNDAALNELRAPLKIHFLRRKYSLLNFAASMLDEWSLFLKISWCDHLWLPW